MKVIVFVFLVIAIGVVSCDSKKDQYLISKDGAGQIKMGMNIEDAKKQFTSDQLENVDLSEYGLDGGGTGLLVKDGKEKHLVFWAYDEKKVNGIICLSDKYRTVEGFRPGMTVKELKTILPKATIQINLFDQRHEFIVINENFSLDFQSSENSRVGKYKYTDMEESVSEMRPEAKVDFIFIKGE